MAKLARMPLGRDETGCASLLTRARAGQLADRLLPRRTAASSATSCDASSMRQISLEGATTSWPSASFAQGRSSDLCIALLNAWPPLDSRSVIRQTLEARVKEFEAARDQRRRNVSCARWLSIRIRHNGAEHCRGQPADPNSRRAVVEEQATAGGARHKGGFSRYLRPSS